LRESKDELAVALVNLANPMMMKGPIREVYPVGPQEVSIAVPAGRRFSAARLLVANRPADARVEGDRVVIGVPGIDLIEVVHVTWG
jgi:hypothetical protein